MTSLRRLAAAAAVALLLAATASPNAHGSAIDLSTPAGLNPGDTFRFVFVTKGTYGTTPSPGTITAASSDINVYNTFVNTEAAGATYGGAVVSWKAIGSTATVDARDNVGGFDTTVPVYLVDGTLVANNLKTNALSGGFWSGRLLGTTTLNLAIDGSVVNSKTWTGSTNDGRASTYSDARYLGSTAYGYIANGRSNGTTNFIDYQDDWYTDYAPMFAMSSNLTVSAPAAVPEIDPAGMASVLALVGGALGLLERRGRPA